MKGRLKWLLAAAVVVAVLTILGTPSAEAARWRVYAYGYPAYAGPAYHPAPYYHGSYHGSYYGSYYGSYWAPPAAVYPSPVIVRRPWIGPAYWPAYGPYAAPYWGW